MLFSYLKFLHIVAMFGAVTLFVGGGVVLSGVARTANVPAIRRVVAVTKRTDVIGVVLLIAGVGFGVGTAWVGEFDFFQTWLILAYVLVGIIFLTGALYHGPHGERLGKAAEASPDDAPSEELARLLNPRREAVIMVVDTLLWISIIFLMVVKPFS